VGFFFTVIASGLLNVPPLPIQEVFWYSFLIYFLSLLVYVGTPPFAVYFAKSHRLIISRLFQKALDSTDFSLMAIGSTILIVNFTLFTVISLLPLQETIVALVPLLKSAQPLIPRSLLELVQWNIMSLFFLSMAPGPAIVFALRWVREENSDRGETLFEILQALFYASLLLVGIAVYRGSTLSGMPLSTYSIILFEIVLPGSIGGSATLGLAEKVRKRLPYIT
jgi:hypothetical protein